MAVYQSTHTGAQFDSLIDGNIEVSGEKTFANNVNIKGDLNSMKIPNEKVGQTLATEEDIEAQVGNISIALEKILGV